MAVPSAPAYGTPNWDLITGWMALEPDDDGPFWALNLMQYHQQAQYADGRSGVSGREADDAYAPLGPLAAVGAMVAFVGNVIDQRLGEPAWDRVGIVRYPTRAAFFEMQRRDDFKVQHVHKEAGMRFTIVMSCLPTAHDAEAGDDGTLVLVVGGGGQGSALDGVAEVASFAVEGVIVGDDRSFDTARLVRVAEAAALDALVSAAGVDAQVVVLEPVIDGLIESLTR